MWIVIWYIYKGACDLKELILEASKASRSVIKSPSIFCGLLIVHVQDVFKEQLIRPELDKKKLFAVKEM